MKKRTIFAVLAVALAVGTVNQAPVSACYGVRAMGMGGAFIGVADDVNAVYWNPAGIAFTKETQANIQHITNNRELINYIDIVEVTTPVKNGAIGLTYVKDRAAMNYLIQGQNYNQEWYVLSYGAKITDNLAIGTNIRQVVEKTALNGQTESKHFTGLDASLFYKNNKWSCGLLVQDFNRPTTLDGGYMIRNYRPGIAYRPDNKTIIAADIYDATDEIERAYCVGAEYKASDAITLRAGCYQRNLTFGIGIKVGKDTEVNFAHLGGDLGGTNMIGAQTKF
ncbi:hypothetical protein [Anaeroselena agilis]|uniref:PorV/PorQ family protein n=1 Tax=Anaeroselena agilis TaxID=3063788 RepID=A0ABU3P4S2_9FIRM|nr:hypothetical protein [Selenomonadales bacterium 4137-cl]